MNAQEAIKIVEYDLEGSKMNTETLEEMFETKLVDSRRSEEALSIVLESAKLLHSGEPEEGPHYYYFDGWHVRKDELPKIGVYPGGADE